MSNRFKHAIIDDVTLRNIDASLQDNLLDLFESVTTPVREMNSTPQGCDGWFGTLQRGDERLDVIGHLK